MLQKFLLLIFFSLISLNVVFAQSSCGPIIADKDSGLFISNKNKSRARYECFKNSQAAEKKGYFNSSQTNILNFTGWYRLKLNTVKENTCDPSNTSGAGAVFLQVHQNESAVFGEFCPSLGEMSGMQKGSEINLTRTAIFGGSSGVSSSAPQPCPDNYFQETTLLNVSRSVRNGNSFSVELKKIRRCLSNQYATLSCVESVAGIGFEETHTIWPTVPSNINAFFLGCASALKTCGECHAEMR